MKRACSFEYTSDEDDNALLAAALDQFEQTGGALPLFSFAFTPVGQRHRWRNVVRGQSFHATLHQQRDARPSDNIGEALTEALSVAINRELQTLNARPHDRVNFSMTAHGFAVAFQSVNFQVREFLERSLCLDALLQSLANKLNSNEEFDLQQGFEVLLSMPGVAMPTPGGRPQKQAMGRRCLEKVLKTKQAIITIKNRDELCCARARELHRLAGVPEGTCAVEELKQFQDVLGTLPIISYVHVMFLLIFKGPPAPHPIRLVKADAHYHGCTSFPAMVNRSYYCPDCEKGYDHEDAQHHPCQGRVCKSCNRKTCPDHSSQVQQSFFRGGLFSVSPFGQDVW